MKINSSTSISTPPSSSSQHFGPSISNFKIPASRDTLSSAALSENGTTGPVPLSPASPWNSVLSFLSSVQQGAVHLLKQAYDIAIVAYDSVLAFLKIHPAETVQTAAITNSPATTTIVHSQQVATARTDAATTTAAASTVTAAQTVASTTTDPFTTLTIRPEDQAKIYDLIHSTATTNPLGLWVRSAELHRIGAEVEASVHPLRFLAYIFETPELAANMGSIHGEIPPLKWNHFIASLTKRMERSAHASDLLKHMPGFTAHLHRTAHLDRLTTLAQQKKWSEFVSLLVTTSQEAAQHTSATTAATTTIPPAATIVATTTAHPPAATTTALPPAATTTVATTATAATVADPLTIAATTVATAQATQDLDIDTLINGRLTKLTDEQKETITSIIRDVANGNPFFLFGMIAPILLRWNSLGPIHPFVLLHFIHMDTTVINGCTLQQDFAKIQKRTFAVKDAFRNSLYGQLEKGATGDLTHYINSFAAKLGVDAGVIRDHASRHDWRMMTKYILRTRMPETASTH